MRDVVQAWDLGSECGYAVLDLEGGLVESGAYRAGKRSGAHDGERWALFNRLAVEVLARYPDRVAALGIERPTMYGSIGRAYNTARLMFGQASLIERHAFARQIETVLVQPSEAKEALTGRGNASKAEMIAAAVARWGPLETPDDGGRGINFKLRSDEADARAVGLFIVTRYCVEALACGELVRL